MNNDLETIKKTIEQSVNLNESEKETLLNAIKKIDKEITILEFKLQRTEKVKRTTSVLLEETIDELEKKRADIEQTNTALKKSLEELKAAQEQLVHSEKMASLGELTAGIAHEIQNPLNFVNNFADVSVDIIDELNEEIENGNLDDVKEIAGDLRQNLEKINHHGQRASSIVKGMLQHSRGSSGKKELTDINALCDEYLRLSYHGFRAKDKSFNADFKQQADENLPKIEVVPQDIGRVLLNLINNAFYAVSSKALATDDQNFKPLVTIITTSSKSPSGDLGVKSGAVEIRISDNGPGIPEQVRDKIFQPFFTTKPTGSGTGLGLSLSYDIVKAHGGELKVETEEGKGTEFIIQIPIT